MIFNGSGGKIEIVRCESIVPVIKNIKGIANTEKGVLVKSPVKYESDMFGKSISNRTQSIFDKFDNVKNNLVEDTDKKQSVL